MQQKTPCNSIKRIHLANTKTFSKKFRLETKVFFSTSSIWTKNLWPLCMVALFASSRRKILYSVNGKFFSINFSRVELQQDGVWFQRKTLPLCLSPFLFLPVSVFFYFLYLSLCTFSFCVYSVLLSFVLVTIAFMLLSTYLFFSLSYFTSLQSLRPFNTFFFVNLIYFYLSSLLSFFPLCVPPLLFLFD